MSLSHFVFHLYAVLGLLIIIFSRLISNFFYNLVLIYTNKMNLNELFIFKIDRNNKDSFYSVAKCFTIMLGMIILISSIYFIYVLNLNIFF
jgi:hypothetical protein